MIRKISIIIAAFLIVIFCYEFVPALDTTTHRAINLKIANSKIGEFSLNDYLIKNLGILNGVRNNFEGRRVETWIELGGHYEDKPESSTPYRRSVNHYHNPLTDKGYSGFFWGLLLAGDSLIDWAQKPLNTQSPGGYYSWHDVRNYYYKALTSLSQSDREKYFSETFRGVGQLMHLVQDASVPAHTRDNAHLFEYEYWLAKNPPDLTKEPIFFDRPILDRPTLGLPISNIFDSNQYKGGNPEVTAGNNIGLTEYANANFFSDGTINSSNFPNPRFDDQTTIVGRPYLSEYGLYTRKYYLKECCGETNGGKGYLLAAVDYYDDWRRKAPSDNGELEKLPVLDNNVYAEYASLLIPRAVGYSAGLLEYFFRGQLQVTSLPLFLKNNLSYVKLKIKNLTPTKETMMNGNFILTYRYTPKGRAKDGSEDVFGRAWALNGDLFVPCVELKYYEQAQDAMEVYFQMIPTLSREEYESIQFMLTFKGTLGKEEGAVIGKYFTPGEVPFYEEWDKGLPGKHAWGHEGLNLFMGNTTNGYSSNVIMGDALVKDSVRYANLGQSRTNYSWVGVFCCNHEQFKDIFPIPVTRNTSLMFKIDQMWINPVPPFPEEASHWQGLWLHFSNGYALQFTQPGQWVYEGNTTAIYTFTLGYNILGNVYSLFEGAGIKIPEGPFSLESISLVQVLFSLGGKLPWEIEYQQHMEVDFIQVIEPREQ